MKLRGILSSHTRRAAWERNQDRAQPAAAPREHHPEPLADGTTRCCSRLYARHAFQEHMRGEPVGMTAGGIAMTQADADEAHAAFEREQGSPQPTNEALEAARIRALTDAYFENERRGKRVVKVGEESIYDF